MNVTVLNPLSYASQLVAITAVNTLYGLTLSVSPLVGSVHPLRIFSIAMVDYGPNSCIRVNYGDGSATHVYGPNRFVSFYFVSKF